MDIEALAIALRTESARTGRHPVATACDQIIYVAGTIDNVTKTTPDHVLLAVLIDNLSERVRLLRLLNEVEDG